MPTFETITVQDALQIVGALADTQAVVNANYFNGDAWQDGTQWIGQKFKLGAAVIESAKDDIQAKLVSKGVVPRLVKSHRDAVIGTEPDWSLTVRRPLGMVDAPDNPGIQIQDKPTKEEQKLIDEAEAALTAWWDERKALGVLQKATKKLLLNSGMDGEDEPIARACLRLFVPPGRVGQNGTVPRFRDLSEALMAVYPHSPKQFQSTVYTDADTQERIGIYAFNHQEGLQGTTEQRVEVHGLDEDRRTIIKLLKDGAELGASQPLELGGHLGLFEMESEPFITPQITQQAALITFAFTMMGVNVEMGGFPERHFFGVQVPGKVQKNKDGVDEFVPNPLYVGAGSSSAHAPLPVYGDPQNPKRITNYASASMERFDPVPVQTFTDTADAMWLSILEEAGQLHTQISGDATSSGESRKQAAAEFLKSLKNTKTQIEAAGRWLLETALAMAAQFAGQPGRFAELRASFSCRLDLGPISADEQRLAIELKDADVIDVTTAMARVGVDDVDAEEAKIAKHKAEAAKLAPAPVDPNAPPVDPAKPAPAKGAGA